MKAVLGGELNVAYDCWEVVELNDRREGRVHTAISEFKNRPAINLPVCNQHSRCRSLSFAKTMSDSGTRKRS